MKLDRPLYGSLAYLFDLYEKAKVEYERTPISLLPIKGFRDIDPINMELVEDSGVEVIDPPTYLVYLVKIEEVLDTPYLPGPYWLQGTIAISTYEQFKLYILRLNPWDFLEEKSKKLTYLAHFAEEYLEKEINGSGKNHLADLLRQLEVDLRVYHEEFWGKLADKLASFPSPTIDEMVEEKCGEVKEFIDNSFKGKKEFCVDLVGFNSEKDAIVKNLAVRLSEGSYKYLNNPSLFLTTTKTDTNQFNNTIGFNNTITNSSLQDKKIGKDWNHPSEQVENSETFEVPIKSEIAENINEWGAQRAYLTKDQGNKHIEKGTEIKELDHFNEQNNDQTQTGDNNQTNTGTNNSFISQESFNTALLNWMDEVIEKYINYEEILLKLDRYFKPIYFFGC